MPKKAEVITAETVKESESFLPPAMADGTKPQLPEVPDEFSASQFLPYVSLVHPLSKDVEEHGAGNWVLYSMGESINLGDKFEAAICHYRNRAVQFAKGGGIERQSYNPKEDLFKEILRGALGGNRGWCAGLDFLIWIPSCELFATIMLGNISGRIVSKTVERNVGKVVTFGVRKAHSKRNDADFFAPTCVRSSSPIPYPPEKLFQLTMEQFLNPPKDESLEDTEKSRDM